MSPESLRDLTSPIRFGAFELDPCSGVLWKHGIRIQVQEQPIRVLLALLEKPGKVITREQLKETLWAGTPFGDFDHSLNIAVNKIREALGDSSANPRYVETVPRRGYRFIAAVERPTAPTSVKPFEVVSSTALRKRKWMPLGVTIAALVYLTAGTSLLRWSSAPPAELQIHRLTNDTLPKFGPVLSDGARLYFQAGSQFGSYIAQLPLSGGEPTKLTVAVSTGRYINLLDISPNRQELLLSASERPTWAIHRQDPAPLWALRIADGSTRRVGALVAQEARYSPDGGQIVFVMIRPSTPGSLWLASSEGSTRRSLLELRGVDVVAPFWSPDGQRIVFGQRDQISRHESTWEVRADGSHLRQLFPDWRKPHLPAGWAPDGRLLITSEGRLWAVAPGRFLQIAQAPPLPVSSAEPRFNNLVQSPGHPIFHGIGTTPLGQLQRLDLRRGTWEPHLAGVSADMVEYSRDGQRLVYVTYPERELWTRRADGSRPVRLTKAPFQGAFARWSPDGALLGFLGSAAPDEPRQIYLVDSEGGTPRLACQRDCGPQGDFTWMPGGRQIVYDAERRSLSSLDVAAGIATKIPNTDGLYSPRCSPDGSMLAALDWRSSSTSLTILRFSEGTWRKTAQVGGFIKWPFWSRDSKFIWYLNAVRGTISKYDVLNNRHEDVSSIDMEELTGYVGTWFALTPTDTPMILRRRDIQQIYALDWKAR